MAHARALLTSHASGRTVYVQADLHDPEAILRHPLVRETLDFGQPVALLLVAVLHFFPDVENPAGIVATLLKALPPEATWWPPTAPPATTTPRRRPTACRRSSGPAWRFQARSAAEFADLALTGLELVPPGMVPVSEWRPEVADGPTPPPVEVGYCGVVAANQLSSQVTSRLRSGRPRRLHRRSFTLAPASRAPGRQGQARLRRATRSRRTTGVRALPGCAGSRRAHASTAGLPRP
jgi:hypothetical protein